MDVTLFYAIMISELGLILILVGRVIGMETLTFVGIIVLAIGVMIPGAMKGLVTGAFEWDGWSISVGSEERVRLTPYQGSVISF